MSLVNMNAESAISSIVESMLPRFSDEKLGLHMEIDLRFADHGYGVDGNTRERKPKDVRRFVNFLFVRSSNYTKFFALEAEEGFADSPVYKQSEWFMESDHDSCWQDAVGSKLNKIHFECHKKFEGRKIGDRPLHPCDLYQWVSFFGHPQYVQLDVFEQKVKGADRFSKEGRVWNVKFHSISFGDLEMVKSPNEIRLATLGLLIKGSEKYVRYLKNCDWAKGKKGE